MRAPTPADDTSALTKDQEVYVSDDNYRNPSREAKHQQDILKDYINYQQHWLSTRTGYEMGKTTTLGTEEAGISIIKKYPIIPRIFLFG